MPRGASRRLWLPVLSAALFWAVAGQATAQQTRAVEAERTGPEAMPTLTGCRLPLPGGGDQDSGLANQYISDRQGSRYLLAPSLTLRQTYSDNITLAPSGQEESDWVTALVPAVSFCRLRPRLRTQVDYEAQMLHYWGDSDRNDVLHRLSTDNTATLIRDRFYLDFGARYDQQPVSSRGAFASDAILNTDNQTDALSMRISPYLYQDLGPVGTSVLRYGLSRTVYDENIRNVTRQSGSLLVISPQEADPMSWQGSVRTERVDRGGRDRVDYFDDAFLELGYRVYGRLRLIGRVGLESELQDDGEWDRFGSDYWEAGFRWSDNRTSVEARYGERFFGETYFASISRRAARHTLSLSYRETQQISDRFTVLAPEDIGLPGGVTDPDTGEFLPFPPIVLSENEIFLSKRATASNVYRTGRSTVRLSLFHDRREYLIAGDEEERYGAEAYWRWQWLPRTAIIPRISWEEIEFRDGREDTLRGAQLSLAHLLSRNMQAGATVRWQDRDSNEGPAGEYTERAISVQLTRLF
ncbi:MAG: TIGR03016 family PEP-CTERM system-associated outer membrane protein [Ectothiorhodospiraceae bacterium]|nr:TIGR03016 family PEP-CTERM system-associated outer membrane protein [Ectothiorhodospiraceae bacterium]